MRVLQINAVNKISSTGRTCLEMSEWLNRSGHECVTAFSKGISVNPDREFRIGNARDVKLHGLFSRLSGKQGYFSFGATKELLKFADAYEPDAVILRNLHGNYINLPMLLKYLADKDIPTVAVLHDCWFFTGKCCHYTVDGCYRWQENCGNCPSLKKYNVSWFFDRTPEMLADKKRLFGAIKHLGVVAVSDWLKGEAEKAPVFENAEVITRIYNWIDTETFRPLYDAELKKELGLDGKKTILFAAAGWSMNLGLKTALEISEKLEGDERMLLVGNLPEDIKTNGRVICLPTTDSVEKLVKLYSLADVFVQPSLEQTFGKVIAEAESCGTPAVCFKSTANPELVGNGCGASVEAGDIDAMLSEIRKILADGKEKYSENCRNFVKANFEMNTNLKEYMKLLQKLCEEKNNG